MKNFNGKQIKVLLKAQTKEKHRFNPAELVKVLKQKSSNKNFDDEDIQLQLEESLKIPFV